MKELNLIQLEDICGGNDFIDGLCVGAGISSIVAPNPVSIGITGGCIVREIGIYWNWW